MSGKLTADGARVGRAGIQAAGGHAKTMLIGFAANPILTGLFAAEFHALATPTKALRTLFRQNSASRICAQTKPEAAAGGNVVEQIIERFGLGRKRSVFRRELAEIGFGARLQKEMDGGARLFHAIEHSEALASTLCRYIAEQAHDGAMQFVTVAEIHTDITAAEVESEFAEPHEYQELRR